MNPWNSWKFNLFMTLACLILVVTQADKLALFIMVCSYYLAVVNFDEELKIIDFDKRVENVLQTEREACNSD